jgi:hypothetical protein
MQIDILKLQKELYSSEEYKNISTVIVFSHSLSIFANNYKELSTFLVAIIEDPSSFELVSDRYDDVLNKLQLENLRLLHNFLASAFTLIDHSRKLYNKLYEKSNLFPAYKSEIERRFHNDPLSVFVVCLRQFIQHYKVPNISANFFWSIDNGRKVSLRIDTADLNGFEWKPKAKEYIATCGDHIDILQLIDEYYSKVSDFYNWFQNEQNIIHRTDLEVFKQKQTEYFSIVIPSNIDAFEQSVRAGVVDIESVMSSSFEGAEIIEIESFESKSPERFNIFLEILEKRCKLSTEYKEKLRELFFHKV